MQPESSPFFDSPGGLIAKLVAARRSGNSEIERATIEQLRQQHGIELRFADDRNGRSEFVANSTREPLLIDAREAAELLKLSARSLWSLTKCGDIAHVRAGRRVLYSPADLDAWIAKHRSGGNPR